MERLERLEVTAQSAPEVAGERPIEIKTELVVPISLRIRAEPIDAHREPLVLLPIPE